LGSIKSISFIGSGNVATHLSQALHNQGFIIEQVFSRNIDHALELAEKVDALAVDNIANINSSSDLYILAVKDDAIESTLRLINDKNIFIVHTSGSIGIDIFKETGFSDYGIFYPLQTFSKNKSVDFLEIPICVEASYEEKLLIDIANQLSNLVYQVSSEQRKKLHLAAVFACNFSNYMYHVAEDICLQNDVNFNILKPLIKETAQKISLNHPHEVQTGPAVRGDQKIIESHLDQLSENKNYQGIYRLITDNILKAKK